MICPFSQLDCRQDCVLYHHGFEICSLSTHMMDMSVKMDAISDEVKQIRQKVKRL